MAKDNIIQSDCYNASQDNLVVPSVDPVDYIYTTANFYFIDADPWEEDNDNIEDANDFADTPLESEDIILQYADATSSSGDGDAMSVGSV